MLETKLFNISEFAKISGVTRQTLIYYDRIGLFSPAVVDENKYRKYSHGQIETISAITILRDLGVPLKKIKGLLKDVSPEKTVEVLNYQLKIINDKIDELSSLKNMLSLRINQIKNGKDAARNLNSFFFETVTKDVPFYVGKEINCKQLNVPDDVMIDFFNTLEGTKIPMIFSMGAIKKAEAVENGRADEISQVSFRLSDDKNANFFMPSGKYLAGYGKGDYGKFGNFYDKMLEYLNINNLRPQGFFYEEYLIDELSEKNPDEFIFKACVKVESKTN